MWSFLQWKNPSLKRNGRLILITPQIKGYHSDSTHIHNMDKKSLEKLAYDNSIQKDFSYSFPFPSFAGKYFIYNENVFIGTKQNYQYSTYFFNTT